MQTGKAGPVLSISIVPIEFPVLNHSAFRSALPPPERASAHRVYESVSETQATFTRRKTGPTLQKTSTTKPTLNIVLGGVSFFQAGNYERSCFAGSVFCSC